MVSDGLSVDLGHGNQGRKIALRLFRSLAELIEIYVRASKLGLAPWPMNFYKNSPAELHLRMLPAFQSKNSLLMKQRT